MEMTTDNTATTPHNGTRKYTSTRPKLPSSALRTPIVIPTADLEIILRPFEPSDLPDLVNLRSQIEVMQWTSVGKVDENIEVTIKFMNRFLPPNDATTFNSAILVRENGKDSEHIGAMGCHITAPVANIGYMIRKEWWSKGIVTNAVRAFLQDWWQLDRQMVELEAVSTDDGKVTVGGQMFDEHADSSVVQTDENGVTTVILPEILYAEIVASNVGSRRVLEKCGFKHHSQYEVNELGEVVTIQVYTLERPAGENLSNQKL